MGIIRAVVTGGWSRGLAGLGFTSPPISATKTCVATSHVRGKLVSTAEIDEEGK